MQKVVIGLSGGLDSAMAAYLLVKQGYSVVGVTMSTWDESVGDLKAVKSGCFGPGEAEDIESASKICERLGIDFHVLDLKKEYQNNVLDYFRKIYYQGKTPNPCVICNQQMKFGLLPEKAEQIVGEYDYFSTGHYVRKTIVGDTYYLAKAEDSKKDQTYFLSRLHQHQLKKLLFPLGLYLKSEVRELALKEGFPELAARKESQDFVETEDYNFIFPEDSVKSGDIVDQAGNVLGRHKGIIYYTVGQRRGLAISGLQEPLYVTGIDSVNNRVLVGNKSSLYSDSLIARDVVWSDGRPRSGVFELSAKIRLQHEDAECELTFLGNSDYKVVFHKPQLSITPGQIIAFYDGDILLGGGFIEVE